MKVITTVCHRDCPDTCFLDVVVEDGRILSVRGSKENPITRGFVCPRGVGDPKRVYSSERVLYPHVREESRAENFGRVTWDEALSGFTERLRSTLETHGPGSVLLYDYPGNQGFLAWQFPQRLWYALGATTTDYSLCASSGHAAIGLHYGLTYGIQLEELDKMDVITFWGNNAKVSSPHHWAFAARARKNHKAVIIDVDPRESPTSESADIRLHPHPGSDVALAYGIARQVILNDGVDKRFIHEWTYGYEAFEKEALSWVPDRVEQVTGILPDQIEAVADVYMHRRPAAFMIGLGLQKSNEGGGAARAVALLPALLGYHRGFHYSDAQGRHVDWDCISGRSLTKKKGRIVSQVSMGRRLASGEFKFVFVLGTNPAVTLPDQSSVREGLKRDDVFVVVQDTHWSETAQFADLVLPAPTNFEKSDVNFCDHHLYCRLSNKAIEPLGESRTEIDVMQEISRRLDRPEPWLYQDPWETLSVAFKGSFEEKSFKDLMAGEVLELRLCERKEYQTPSGKIEFSSSTAPGIEARDMPFQTELNTEEDGYLLLNSSIPKYTHSQFTDVYGPIPQIVWINKEDARTAKIREGDTVVLHNERGRVMVKAVVNEKVKHGVLWSPRPLFGLGGNPLNILTPGTPQKLGGGPNINCIRVKMRKAGKGC
ncbi:MAG: molybdopterin-dependent oxidoreductase [Desulfatiglandaceae bacterium]